MGNFKPEELAAKGFDQVKKCPFCGGTGKLTKKSKTYIKRELTQITYCYCADCNSRGRRVVLNEDGRDRYDSWKLAITHWNRRA